MTKKRECRTEIDWVKEKHSTAMLLSAEPHTNPEEEARRPVMEAYRKQAGTDRKPATAQQHGSHWPPEILTYCKLLIHKQTNHLKDRYASMCLPVCLTICVYAYIYSVEVAGLMPGHSSVFTLEK